MIKQHCYDHLLITKTTPTRRYKHKFPLQLPVTETRANISIESATQQGAITRTLARVWATRLRSVAGPRFMRRGIQPTGADASTTPLSIFSYFFLLSPTLTLCPRCNFPTTTKLAAILKTHPSMRYDNIGLLKLKIVLTSYDGWRWVPNRRGNAI
jgi:hypothetical protein